MNKEKSCGAVVFADYNTELSVLLIQHVSGGHWAFPKGHVEDGETEEETALREIREETGLTVKLDTGFRQVTTYSPAKGVLKDVIYFIAFTENTNVIMQTEEVAQIKFVPLQDAVNLITFKSDKNIFLSAAAYINPVYSKITVDTDISG